MDVKTIIPFFLLGAIRLECAALKEIVLPYSCSDLDIMFVVDGSGSVGADNFQLVREWLNSSVVKIHRDLGPKVQIGVLQYANKDRYEIPFRIGDCSTEQCMTSKLREMSYLQGNTYTYYALKYTMENEFSNSSRFQMSKKLIVLITDGVTRERWSLLKTWYPESTKRNITTFAVGVGDNVGTKQLQLFANGGKGNESVYAVKDFKQLPIIVSKMAELFCEDNDECELQADNCTANQTCANFPGSFSCNCQDGFKKSGDGLCSDNDECELQADNCTTSQTCVNSPGSFSCHCMDGFEESEDGSCLDNDECELRAHNCTANQTCANSPGSFSCNCQDGFKESGDGLCSDNDECELRAHDCTTNQTCANSLGSFSCNCKDGFKEAGDGSCLDVNECEENGAICGGKTCTNIVGGYTCGCAKEFFEEKDTCSECSCLPKEGYEEPDATCDGEYSCSYGQNNGKTTCVVPSGNAFEAVFNAIKDWSDNAGTITNRSHVMEKVRKIDEAIRCAAVATRGRKVSREVEGIEAISKKLKTPSALSKHFHNLSQSIVHRASLPVVTGAQMVGVQFKAPKESMNLMLGHPENNDPYSTLRSRYVYADQSPMLSVSLFGGERFDYRRDGRVRLEVDVDVDFANASLESQFAIDPVYWTGYVRNVEYRCMFVDTETGRMSEDGCSVTEYAIGSRVICDCSHTTMFAVLLSYTAVEIPQGVQIVSYISCSLSVLFLILTVIILLNVRPKIRGDRIGIQICLAFSLLFLHLSNLLQDLAAENDVACKAAAVIIHYFLLASGMWMLMEGITLLMKTNDHTLKYLSEGNQRNVAILRHTVSWGVPFVIVTTSATIGFINGSYMHKAAMYLEEKARQRRWSFRHENEHSFCWLSQTYRLWSVIVPMGIIIFVNCVILVRMGMYIYRMSSQGDQFRPTSGSRTKSDKDHVKATFRALAVLLPVLGISWALAFLTSTDDRHSSIVFMYINAVVNGLQGVFLFFIYCVISREVRKALKLKYERRKNMHSSLKKSSNNKSNGNNAVGDVDKQKAMSLDVLTKSSRVGPTAPNTQS